MAARAKEWERLGCILMGAVEQSMSEIEEIEAELRDNRNTNETLVWKIQQAKIELSHCNTEIHIPTTTNLVMSLFEHCADTRRLLLTLFSKLKSIKHSIAKEVVAHHYSVVHSMTQREILQAQEFAKSMPLSL